MPNFMKTTLALLGGVVGVHAVYVAFIRPHAERTIANAYAQGLSASRSFSVILKDYEQEICVILMCWGIYLMVDKYLAISRHRYLFGMKLIGDPQANYATTLQEMQSALHELESIQDAEIRNAPLLKTLRSAARRYVATEDVQNTSDAIVTGVDALAARIESENSMLRYLIWAIPSLGFIGTVRGIGQALSQADQALAGDIAGMTNSLGVAFNSTLVALLISILLMFLLHELQRMQDKLVVDTQAYCEEFLLDRLGKK